MRLAVFTNQFPPGSTFLARDLRALLDAGFDVDVFSFYPLDPELWRSLPEELDATTFPRHKARHISLLKSVASLRPWPIRKIGLFLRDTSAIAASACRFGLRPLAKSAYVFPKAWAWSRLFGNRYDHVFAYWGNYSATCAYIFHRLTNPTVPFSMWLHAGVDLYEDQVYLRQKVLYADHIFLGCEFNRQFLRNLYPDIYSMLAPKIFMHHTSIDMRTFDYKPDGRLPHRILAVGGLEKYKGFDYLLRAAHELARRGVEVEVEVVGGGSQAHELRRLAQELSLSERVLFPGHLPSADVRRAMERATMLVHPSPGIGDAVPTVIKEAMAVGAPVVASDVAGIPELLDWGRCGLLVPPADPHGIADAVQRLLDNPALRLSYAEAAREHAEQTFDLQRNGARLARFFASAKKQTDEHPAPSSSR
jgi:colanic acid/amylovoran biosynthesis glycosyltransferase